MFDGRTGFGFTINNPEEVSHIVENIRSHPMKRVGISLGAVGYGLKISYVDAEDHAVIPLFFSTVTTPSVRIRSSTNAAEVSASITFGKSKTDSQAETTRLFPTWKETRSLLFT